MTNVIQFAKSGEVREMPDIFVERLRAGDHTIKMPDGSIEYINHAAADLIEKLYDFIEKQAKYIEAYQNQTNILLRSVEMLEAKLAEKEDD
jgi:hypothetical protein